MPPDNAFSSFKSEVSQIFGSSFQSQNLVCLEVILSLCTLLILSLYVLFGESVQLKVVKGYVNYFAIDEKKRIPYFCKFLSNVNIYNATEWLK